MAPELHDQENIEYGQQLNKKVRETFSRLKITDLEGAYQLLFGERPATSANGYVRIEQSDGLIETHVDLFTTDIQTLSENLFPIEAECPTREFALLFQFPGSQIQTMKISPREYVIFRSLQKNGVIDPVELSYNFAAAVDLLGGDGVEALEEAIGLNLIEQTEGELERFFERAIEIGLYTGAFKISIDTGIDTEESMGPASEFEINIDTSPTVESEYGIEQEFVYLWNNIKKNGAIDYGAIVEERLGESGFQAILRKVRKDLLALATKHPDTAKKFRDRSVRLKYQIEECNRTLGEPEYYLRKISRLLPLEDDQSGLKATEMAEKLYDFYRLKQGTLVKEINFALENTPGAPEFAEYKKKTIPREIMYRVLQNLVKISPPRQLYSKQEVIDFYTEEFNVSDVWVRKRIDKVMHSIGIDTPQYGGLSEVTYQMVIHEIEKSRFMMLGEQYKDKDGLEPYISLRELAKICGVDRKTVRIALDEKGIESLEFGKAYCYPRALCAQIIDELSIPHPPVGWAHFSEIWDVIDTHLIEKTISGKGEKIAPEIIDEAINAAIKSYTGENQVAARFRGPSNRAMNYYNLGLLLTGIMNYIKEKQYKGHHYILRDFNATTWEKMKADLESTNHRRTVIEDIAEGTDQEDAEEEKDENEGFDDEGGEDAEPAQNNEYVEA